MNSSVPVRSGASPEPVRQAKTTPHSGPFITRVNGYRVIDCKACDFRHVLPLPTAEELAATYAEDYYAQIKPTYLQHAKDDEPWAQLAYDDRLDAMAASLKPDRRRLVDIGAGPGSFLAHAVSRGWQATGVEPSRQAASSCRDRGLDVVEAFFSEEIAREIGRVDAVHLMNMLEHVPDPRAIIELAARMLAPGGALCVGVPNDYNPLQRLLSARRVKPWWVAPPHHLNFFDFDALERLVVRVGLTPRARLTSFPMELFLTFGCNYIGDDALGRACHTERRQFDIDLEQAAPGRRNALYQALASAGFGREAIIVATKD